MKYLLPGSMIRRLQLELEGDENSEAGKQMV